MSTSTSTTTTAAPPPVGHYPHARRVGQLLFLSGIGPRSPRGEPIPAGIESQCRAVFANVRGVLEAAGSSWERLVDVTVYLTDIPSDFATFNRLWAEYFPIDPPCRTTVEVTRLPTPIAIELKCIATLED
jgi:2-aminomuconate deaminase